MKARKSLCIALIMAMILVLLPQTAVSAEDGGDGNGIDYLYYDTASSSFVTGTCTSYVLVTDNNDSANSVRWENGGWYVVRGNVTVNNTILVLGDVHLILTDRSALTVNGHIQVEDSRKLTIYAQTTALSSVGRLTVTASENCAGIGGGHFGDCGTINIHGGWITATGGEDASGIGGGYEGDGGNVTVYGGTIRADGGAHATGIGSGNSLFKYTREAGSVTVYGGSVSAFGGDNAAGIGGCGYCDGATVVVYGGSVSANGGAFGAGIGGGDHGDGGTFLQYGGYVSATGDGGAGVGGGYEGDGFIDDYKFGFYGGTLKALGRAYHAEVTGSRHAVGAGMSGGDHGHVFFGNDLIFIDCETNLPVEDSYSINWKSYFTGRAYVYVSAQTLDGFPFDYQVNFADGTSETRTCTDYTYLHNDVPIWRDGWYVMTGVGSVPNGISVQGDAHLILTNDCHLTLGGSIIIDDGCSLTIYAQPVGEGMGNLGKLTVNGSAYISSAIGGSGDVIIQGGEIEANGGNYGAGIGGLYNGQEDNISVTIYSGIVKATGSSGAAGIGGSYQGSGCRLTIYGGSICATGGYYFSKYYRGIGAGSSITDNGSIRIGDGLDVIDNTTGNVIDRGFAQADWIDVLSGTTVDFSVVPASTEREPVSYVYYDTESGAYKNGVCDTYDFINKNSRSLTSGWYVLGESGTLANVLTVDGDVHLILKDNCTLTTNEYGIRVTEGNSLTIYAQSAGSNAGKIIADASDTQHSSGIGGASGVGGGVLVIHGGNITAKGGQYSSGIGGGGFDARTVTGSDGCDLTVYGGTVTAIGGKSGAGIGGSIIGNGGNVTIYGGNVTAIGGSAGGAGIGGGYNSRVAYNSGTVTNYTSAGNVTILGGTVTATGGYNAAGIGGGYGCDGGVVRIGGGNVTATSGDHADGIGTGWFDTGDDHLPVKDGTVILYGGTVTSNGTSLHVHSLSEVSAREATCTETGISTSYYVCEGCGKYFADAECVTELTSAQISGYVIAKTGHDFTNNVYHDNGDGTHSRKCAHCDAYDSVKSAHVDSDSDYLCDLCGHDSCDHASTTDVFTWYINHTVCMAVRKCSVCGRVLESEVAYKIVFTEEIPARHCAEYGKGSFTAKFHNFADQTTEPVFESGVGPHTDDDGNGFCDHCGVFTVTGYRAVTLTTLNLTTGNWYVNGYEFYDDPIVIDGNVTLYFRDKSYINARNGIVLTEGSSLTVNAQSDGENAGYIIASGKNGAAGIGGQFGQSAGTLTVNGGKITATGDLGAAGIGGGFNGNGGVVVINGGTVVSNGGVGAAGIGGGFNGNGGDVTVNGGTLDVSAGAGAVAGQEGAGIGGGYNGTNGNIVINNVKKLTARGGRALGAGINTESASDKISVANGLKIKSGTSESDAVEIAEIADDGYVVITELFTFDAKNLALESVLAFRFKGYLNVDDPSDDAYMEFKVGNVRTVKVPLADATVDENGRYVFTCYLNVLEVNEKIRAIFHDGDVSVERRDPLSVNDYLDLVAANHKAGTAEDKKVLALIEAVADYAHWSQLALDETHTEYTVGNGEDDTYHSTAARGEVTLMSDEVLARFVAVKTVKDGYTSITETSRSLVLDDRTAIVIYLTPADAEYVPAVKVTNEKGDSVAFTCKKQKDGRWRVLISGIAAHQLGDTYTVDVDDGGITYTNLSALSYACSVFGNNKSNNYKYAVSALYEYYTATLEFMK